MVSISKATSDRIRSQVGDYQKAGNPRRGTGGGGGGAGGGGMYSHSNQYRQSDDLRYYRALRDVPYSAIRPIAVRFASQSLRVAAVPRRKRYTSYRMAREGMRKALSHQGYIGETMGSAFESHQKQMQSRMSPLTKQMMPSGAVVLDEHELLDTLGRPNDVQDGWSMRYCMAASLMTCGKSLLVWDDSEMTAGASGKDTAGVYYIPMHWTTPRHEDGPFSKWMIRPDGFGTAFEADAAQCAYFRMPDVTDPLGGFSPMMADARNINTADKIVDAHQAGLNNLISPSYAVVAGSFAGQGGGKPRFDKQQRRDITAAIKQYIGGVMRNGEPIILDALIEDIRDISPKHNDIGFVQGDSLTTGKTQRAFGVSPIVMGESQSANRAGSATAHDIFYDLVVNPLLTLSGEVLTHSFGQRFNTDEYRLVVYHEEARANDHDGKRARVVVAREHLNRRELREYARTGETNWDDDAPADDAENDR